MTLGLVDGQRMRDMSEMGFEKGADRHTDNVLLSLNLKRNTEIRDYCHAVLGDSNQQTCLAQLQVNGNWDSNRESACLRSCTHTSAFVQK